MAFRLWTHEGHEHSRAKRAIPNTIFTTELGVFVDAATFTSLQSNYHAISPEDKVYMIGIRLNAAQALFNYMQQDLGYTAKMQVKSVELWETNPAWYVLTPDSITETRSSFCTGTKDRNDLLAVDYNILFAGGNDMIGFGSISGQCVKGACAVDFDLNFYSGYITAHELGHSLGMHHDADKGCFRPDSGIMEADGNYADKWASCNKVDLEAFLATSTAACLFVENVLSNQVDVLLQNVQLIGLLPGFQMTQDEYCEKKYGTNWIYREWHSNDWGVCKWHSCLNLNSGLAFGELSEDTSDIPGRICSEGHVCSGGCVTWDSVRLNTTGMTVVPGGWSEWGAATACSRSCDTGTIIRRRTCTNPRPQYSPTCPGLSFKATLCNTEPCSSDPSTKSELIVKRAGEVCSNLITAGRLGADKYTGTGKAFVSSGNAQCEAECTLVPALQGSITWGTVRYAILPDGTPCSGAGSYEDIKGYPRGTGITSTCVQGYCLGIGCDGNVPGAGIDKCGVCQGTNSTCTSVDDKFSSAVGTNDRVELAHLPNGTKLILVYFPYPNMQSYYVELWDAKGAAKISALVNGQYDLSKTPVTVGGAQWYYYWWGQYLYTFGTITEDLYLKIVNNGASVNQGITFGYSMPLAATVTTVTTTSTSTAAQSTTSSTTAQSTTSSTTAQSTTSSTTAQSTTSSTTAQSTTQSTTTPSTLPSTTSPSTTSSTIAQSTTSSTTTPSSTPSTTTTTTTTTTSSTTSMPASTLTSIATSSATPVPQPTLTSTTTQVTPAIVSTTTRKVTK
ncbi:A disintegrin and metalloproteinase with thrombospondin motifs adt-1-like [Dreissena polymorpha]|uniref:A disintegrin and metalloproteinase with thrombospondin motifs adt-1-like n=1 Tax=Dreissena polymorpha TaxID=45954 RepID=UPI00226564F4|nr:A disintegrin and metalloproteinase with thrombospondin motifs adt-1-like [Dreissena polymorpha]